jgi:hypothetical protein
MAFSCTASIMFADCKWLTKARGSLTLPRILLGKLVQLLPCFVLYNNAF